MKNRVATTCHHKRISKSDGVAANYRNAMEASPVPVIASNTCSRRKVLFVTITIILIVTIAIVGIQDPVVQSIVSLTISLRHKFVKQISAKVTNTLLFFVEKM